MNRALDSAGLRGPAWMILINHLSGVEDGRRAMLSKIATGLAPARPATLMTGGA